MAHEHGNDPNTKALLLKQVSKSYDQLLKANTEHKKRRPNLSSECNAPPALAQVVKLISE